MTTQSTAPTVPATLLHGWGKPLGHPRSDEAVQARPHPKGHAYGRRGPWSGAEGPDRPVGWQVLWCGRWRNCYVMQYCNGGATPYIKTGGGRIHVRIEA